VRTPLYALAPALPVALTLIACGSSGARDDANLPPAHLLPASRSSHVAVVVMENKERSEVMGSSDAPYLTSLANRYASPSKFYAITHPSLPNYLALTGGRTFGITDDCTDCNVSGSSIADQLEHAGYSWKAYMQGIPHACYRGAEAGNYAKKHDPFMYYNRIRTSRRRCNKVVRFRNLQRDLRKGRLPAFVWITPDLCHDTHDCSIKTGDGFLRHLVPALLREIGPHGFVIVTYDEGESDAGCCGVASGGRIATVLAGPDVRRHAKGPGTYTHYSTLRTIEDAFGLPHLGHAGGAPSLAPLFTQAPRVHAAGGPRRQR
jgi:phosphatidylinositol-3-phosphatase